MLQAPQSEGLDQAFEALKRYKAGDDAEVLIPIDKAVMDVPVNAPARAALEQRLAAFLASSYPSVTRAFACRELALIGTAASVPALAPLLIEDELTVFARNALERIPGPEADKALREAINKARGTTRLGIIYSLGVRRDARSASVLSKILTDDQESAPAAAKALGEIGTPEAANALAAAHGKGPSQLQRAVADGILVCAERLLEAGDRSQAVKLVQPLTDPSSPVHVRVAANRALSARTKN
jgi:HEAT repeat protein